RNLHNWLNTCCQKGKYASEQEQGIVQKVIEKLLEDILVNWVENSSSTESSDESSSREFWSAPPINEIVDDDNNDTQQSFNIIEVDNNNDTQQSS
ncbi:18694_t:CDS:2, partial [Dentiscutata erythropus]